MKLSNFAHFAVGAAGVVPALATAVLILLSASSAIANQGPVFAGKTIGNWGLAWWQWTANFPSAYNPIAQQSGPVDCSTGQPRQILFLAGTFGGLFGPGNGTVERSCTVKPGRTMFFPIANSLFWKPEDCPGAVEDNEACIEALRKQASEGVDAITAQSCTVTVDDKPAKPCTYFGQVTRAQSDPLPFNIPDQSWVVTDAGYTPGLREFAISDGYWAMLHPLPVGKHKIHFTANNNAKPPLPPFALDVTYHLTVAP